jgi:23S rRNA (uracil1939-C5)-methyltransferase
MGQTFGVAEQRAARNQNIGSRCDGTADRRRADAAVDLEVDLETGRRDHLLDLADLGFHRGDVGLTAESGIDGHHEHHVDQIEDMCNCVGRGRRVEGDRRSGPERRDVSERAVQVLACLDVHDQPLASGIDVLLRHCVGREYHQVGFERQRTVLACAGDHVRTERQVGHELSVHHVELDPVDARSLEGLDLCAEHCEVDGQYRGCDLDRAVHPVRLAVVLGCPSRTIPVVETVDLDALNLVVGGDALAREASGRVIFIAGAIPGETVRVWLTVAKKDFAKGTVAEVLTASPDRVTPACQAWHRGCGGCDWQHIEPVSQLRYKTSIVTEALMRTARVDAPVVVASGSVQPWGYRTTVRMAVVDGVVGFRARASHHIVPVASCPVADPAINAALAAPGAVTDGEISLRTSVATGALIRSDRAVGGSSISEVVAGHRFRVSVDSFFQSSPAAAELLVAAVRRALTGIDLSVSVVVDAYGGIGLFAATVAAEASEVIVVEGSPSACADAIVNLHGRRASVVQTRVEDWEPVAADVVIADPARSGLDKEAVAVLVSTGAPVIVLVSCDTGSLARDVRLLCAAGYEHSGTQVIDAFPNTSHIETVTRFARCS